MKLLKREHQFSDENANICFICKEKFENKYLKELTEELKKQFTCSGEKIEKYITFTVPMEKGVLELLKMEKKLQQIYPTDYTF